MRSDKHNRTGTPAPRWTATRARDVVRRGSVLLLVLVVIVILALLGMTYLAVARVDLRTTSGSQRDNMETIIAATIGQIQGVLRDDLIDGNGTTFNTDNAVAVSGVNTGYDEPYDYPWTNQSGDMVPDPVAASGSGWPAPTGTAANVKGGVNDDAWLAASATTGSTGSESWPKITNLNGIWVRLPSSTGAALPEQNFVDNGSNLRRDVNLSVAAGGDLGVTAAAFESNGVDADGDGILDSRWTWAPIRQIGSTMYVIGVRIIDNSARVNPSVSWYTDGTSDSESPRWWAPVDLRVTGAASAGGALGVDRGDPEFVDWAGWVFNNLGHTHATRWEFWNAVGGPASGLGGSTTAPVLNPGRSAAAEVELMNANGLNSNTKAPIEETSTGMPTLLREDGSAETVYTDFDSSVDDYFQNNSRLRMSHYNGSSQLATAQHGGTPLNGGVLFRLWEMWDNSDIPLRTAKRATFLSVLRDQDMPFAVAGPSAPVGGTYGAGGEFTTLDDLSAQYLASAIDAFDQDADFDGAPDLDSTVTEISGRFGMEALPFISEVYLQGAYVITSTTPAYVAAGNYTSVLHSLQGHVGYVIELFNPFSSAVQNLEHVRVRVSTNNGTSWTVVGGPTGTLYSLLGGAGSAAQTGLNNKQLAGRTGIVLWRSSGDGTSPKTAIPFTTPANWREPLTELTDAIYTPTGAQTVAEYLSVELQVKVDPTTSSSGTPSDHWVTYSRLRHNNTDTTIGWQQLGLVNNWRIGTGGYNTAPYAGPFALEAGATNAVKYRRFMIRSAYANATALNLLAVKSPLVTAGEFTGNGVSVVRPAQWPVPVTPANQVTPPFTAMYAETGQIGQVGVIAKNFSNTAGTFAANRSAPASAVWLTDPSWAQRAYALDDVGVRYPTDLLRVMWVGPTATKTYPEVFTGAGVSTTLSEDSAGNTDLTRCRMLNPYYDGADPTNWDVNLAATGSGNRRVTRAQLLMDRVVATRTQDSTVPILGRMNLNTAPIALIEKTLPLTNASTPDASSFVAHLKSMREGTLAGRTRGSIPGIASLGELMQVTPRFAGAVGNTSGTDAWARDSSFTAATDSRSVAFDGGGNPLTSGPVDDRAEEVRLAGMLANLYGVRSDYFTAYVVVRGYPASNWNKGPIEAAKFIVVLDRSKVTSLADSPRIVAYRRY